MHSLKGLAFKKQHTKSIGVALKKMPVITANDITGNLSA
jgi:hypothetical protein